MCTSSPSSRAFCAVRRGTHAHEATSAQGTRSRANSLGRPETKTTAVRMATATHATRPRTSQRPRKVVAGVEARGLISPAARLRLCSLDSIVTTPLYRTIVSRALRQPLRRSFSELNRADHAHHKEGRSCLHVPEDRRRNVKLTSKAIASTHP